jgi:drug/metabolite transporter (DMT)-like permease
MAPSANVQRRAALELVLAGLLWGFGFIATRWAFESFEPLTLTTARFFLAAVVAAPYFFYSRVFRNLGANRVFRATLVPGCLLGLCLGLQTLGLKYTTVAKSSFLTALYVVFVPLLETVLFRKRLGRTQWFWVGLAVTGTAFMCEAFSKGFSGGWNIGDFLTLLCSLAAAGHILSLEKLSHSMPPTLLNWSQTVWAALLNLPLCFFETSPVRAFTPRGLAGLAFLAFGSTMIAFLIQVRSQRVLSPSTVSLLFLLESPFATAFGFMILGEAVLQEQWAGAALILCASLGTILLPSKGKN